ncbi:hypothetical protein Plim_0751 [Planctopirus limnophila DSM 3776]|uniref:Chromosome partition protein Smc n=1 Tax=Planctopirus limnophila (strain ATCC 43296 / DSM 3776 / IFAM 1008 / Mu 290) TaxID=521674 RepID=D5SRR3_PLAL2|nr:hypothetical protein [Planctopirus limnophila]ADG66597.1 hypothetical protein Plim_0751 [Planctopirus limnophila DSM 3776]
MAQLGRILVVIVVAASLGFAAFAASLANGGRNWVGDTQNSPLNDYFEFNSQPGEKTTYTATHRLTKESAGSGVILSEVVNSAKQKLNQELSDKLQKTQAEIDALKPRIPQIQALRKDDEQALVSREAELLKNLDAVRAKILAATEEAARLGGEIEKVRGEGEERRAEVYRLKNQLELIRNDLFAATQQKNALTDELLRLEQNLDRLKRRQAQLKQLLGEPYDDQVPANGAPLSLKSAT